MVVREAAALFAARISGIIGSGVEASVAAIFVGPSASAILVLTGRVLSVVQMFPERIGTAVFAGMAHVTQSSNERRRTIVKELLTLQLMFVGIGAGMTIAFTRPIVTLWVGSKIFGGTTLLLVIVMAGIVVARRSLLSSITMAFGAIRTTSKYMIVETGMRLLLMVGLAARVGLIGIPFASFFAATITTIVFGGIVRKLLNVTAREIILPGIVGFIPSIVIGLIWLLAVPTPSTWLAVLAQATTCGFLMLACSVVLDKELASALRYNLGGMRRAITARSSAQKPEPGCI
jgi:O-antigen/teichoic acid export membrane protein